MSVLGVILVRIFPHLDWIRRDTEYTEKYGVSLRAQSECPKIRTRITPHTGKFFFLKKRVVFGSTIVLQICAHAASRWNWYEIQTRENRNHSNLFFTAFVKMKTNMKSIIGEVARNLQGPNFYFPKESLDKLM